MVAQKKAVLRAKDIYKDFHLPHEKNNSLKSAIVGVFSKVDKSVDIQHALRGVSFDVHEGEFFGILGRNGSGKSTLLKILAEIYQPTRGKMSKVGKLVPFIELGVGFNPELTGRENVYLNGALLGFSEKEIDARYDEIVEFAELEEFMDQKLKNYSSGMQVRLAFSVATRAEADILLVDEVLAVGDADFQRKCYDFFKSLKRQGKTVVFVTHSMDAVREYCDKAILINDGVITHQGGANRVADEYLKLFNTTDTIASSDPNRWGNGQVRIANIEYIPGRDKMKLRVLLETGDEPVEDCVFGYRFTDAEERVIAGGNSLNAQQGVKLSFSANEAKSLTFEIDNIFGTTNLWLSATVRLGDGTTICDSWSNIKKIGYSRSEGHYPVVMPAKLEVQSDKKTK